MVRFSTLETSVQNPGGLPYEILSGVTDAPFGHELEPRGELRVNGGYGLRFTVGARSGFGEMPGGQAGIVVRYRFRGQDGQGRPVAVVMHVPLDPGVGRRAPAAPAAAAPRAPSARPPATPPTPELPTPVEPAPAREVAVGGPAADNLEPLRRAATDCQGRFPSIEQVSVDSQGGASFRYGSPEDDRGFRACYETRTREVLSGQLATSATPGASVVALESRDAGLVVAITLGPLSARLLVDTGAQKTLVRPALLQRIGAVPGSPWLTLVTVSGERVSLPLARVDALTIGPFSVRDLYVGAYDVVPGSVDGVLGQDVLGHFRVHIDGLAGRLSLEPLP